ncbi:MAG: hypothetical protein ACTSX0_10465 [Promethearchaeota archaeon]
MRKDYFLLGLGFRVIMLFFFIQLNETNHYNDASLIIYKGFLHILNGENPYSFIYELPWGTGTFYQPLNYGPLVFILFLPAMFIPIWYHDLWIGMAIMINLYSFGIAEILSNMGSRDAEFQSKIPNSNPDKDVFSNKLSSLLYYGGILFWLVPFGTTVISVFIYAPIFLTTLAFIYRKNPILSGFFLMIGALTYQIVLLLVPIFGIYYLKQNWSATFKFVLGCIPALIVLCFFIFWQYPAGTIDSLFLYTSRMPYIKCETCGNDLDRFSFFSIPHLLYIWSNGNIQVGNYFRLGVVVILGIYCLLLLFQKKESKEMAVSIIRYQILSVILFTLTTNYGQMHYLFFTIIPIFFLLQYKKPNWSKSKSINPEAPRRISDLSDEKIALSLISKTIISIVILFFALFGLHFGIPGYFLEFQIVSYQYHGWVKWVIFIVAVLMILIGIITIIYRRSKPSSQNQKSVIPGMK